MPLVINPSDNPVTLHFKVDGISRHVVISPLSRRRHIMRSSPTAIFEYNLPEKTDGDAAAYFISSGMVRVVEAATPEAAHETPPDAAPEVTPQVQAPAPIGDSLPDASESINPDELVAESDDEGEGEDEGEEGEVPTGKARLIRRVSKRKA